MSATAVTIVTDMGNGGIFCDKCWYELDFPIPSICPKCQAIITEISEPYINMGGSDF